MTKTSPPKAPRAAPRPRAGTRTKATPEAAPAAPAPIAAVAATPTPAHPHHAAGVHLSGVDPVMAGFVESFGPHTLKPEGRDLFTTLMQSIVSQLISTKAADTITGRVRARLGIEKGEPMPPAAMAALTVEDLRACGLSRAKAGWMIDIARRTLSGALDFESLRTMDADAAADWLDALPGIGRWTAEMVLIFALGHADVFSPGDMGLRLSLAKHYPEAGVDFIKMRDKDLRQHAERWKPYRSAACWYLWRAKDGPADMLG